MSDWTREDVRGTLRVLPFMWDYMLEGVEGEVEQRVGVLRERAESRLDAIERPDDPQARTVIEAALDDLSEAGRVVADSGAVAPMKGVVAGVYRSSGGVPKQPVAAAAVGTRGLEGDRQHDRRNHGRPWQALCLWSTEVIEALQAEGHPIGPGSAGENLTLSGLEWEAMRPGLRLRMGEVLAEITAPALPCATNARWFLGGDFMRMDHGRHPGSSRWYASVLQPGPVRPGDHVIIEP